MIKKIIFISLLSGLLFSQVKPIALDTYESSKFHLLNQKDSRFKNIHFAAIGPAIMSGRVVALAVNPKESSEFYVAYASGGIWYTKDNGISFTPIMNNAPTQNVGEISMHWPSNTLWVGTGENNSSRSSYAGIGILRTKDNGKTWTHHGLSNTHHIGKIIINPDDPKHIVVGSTGPLYSSSEARGIYVSKDEGVNWKKTLYINDETGIIDMDQSPEDPSIIFATSWEKDRKAWNFKGSGFYSGIYKSIDFGENWQLISVPNSGFPVGNGVGRIGLAVYNNDIIYAIHDSQFRREKKQVSGSVLSKDDFKNMSKSAFLSLDNNDLNKFLKNNGFPKKHTAKSLKKMIKNGSLNPLDLSMYLEDANTQLFDTPVIGPEVYKSENGGLTWKKTHKEYLDGVYNSYGYYFGHIHVAPKNQKKIYIYGVPLLTSDDGGETFYSIGKNNVHSDHHALWINPEKPGHLINGNDGGINITYDDGVNWVKNNSTNVGQFYSVNVDYEKPYNVYGGLQDNGVWKGANNSIEDSRWQATGKNPWKRILGGDGMQVQIDKRNSNIVYTGYQFGNYFRLNLGDGESSYRKSIKPKHELGESPYRYNWQTPILLSKHNQDIVYFGSNKLHQSFNKGDSWSLISGDLTFGGKKGNVAYGTITTISESPFKFGLLYTGSDDGKVSLTFNGGVTWAIIAENLPKDLWVSRVVASSHIKSRVYLTFNGYRSDDFKSYVYVSNDYGKTWVSIIMGLPDSPVNIIYEDPKKSNILYLGNDIGTYISLNNGKNWEAFQNGLTTAAVHDLVVQSEANDLIIGTHGRSIFKSNIELVQSLTPEILDKPIHLFEIKPLKFSKRWGSRRAVWSDTYKPSFRFAIWSKLAGKSLVSIRSNKGILFYEKEVILDIGFNEVEYNLSIDKEVKSKNNNSHLGDDGTYYLPIGRYSLDIKKQGKTQSKFFSVN
mgnify:FL=1